MPGALPSWAETHPERPRQRATREQERQVKRILRAHSLDLTHLTERENRALLPVFQQAEKELTDQLRKWIQKSPDGRLRWTAQSHQAALLYAKVTAARLEKALGIRLDASTERAQEMAIAHLTEQVARYSEIFEGTQQRLALDVKRLIALDRSYIIPRIRTSAARYAWRPDPTHPGVYEDIKQRLAVDMIKGSTVYETVNRLVEHGGPRGMVALRGVAGEEGAIVEYIPEGLFRRYRWWAQRIVRTETSSAYGVQAQHSLMAARDQVPGLKKRWNAEGGGCPRICAPIDGEVVEIDAPFSTPIGPVMTSPAHPNCRCESGPWKSDWPELFKSVGL